MGQVLKKFTNGFPGTPSRTGDEIIITMKNGSEEDIPSGAPVFLMSNGACEPFDSSSPQEFDSFVGFAVRVPDKTADTVVTGQFDANPPSAWHPGEVMEVLVRGAIALTFLASSGRGAKVYLRKSDGKLTTSAGTSGTSIELENVRVRNEAGAANGVAEAIVIRRNIL